jgi:hypothetical protein
MLIAIKQSQSLNHSGRETPLSGSIYPIAHRKGLATLPGSMIWSRERDLRELQLTKKLQPVRLFYAGVFNKRCAVNT